MVEKPEEFRADTPLPAPRQGALEQALSQIDRVVITDEPYIEEDGTIRRRQLLVTSDPRALAELRRCLVVCDAEWRMARCHPGFQVEGFREGKTQVTLEVDPGFSVTWGGAHRLPFKPLEKVVK